MKAMQWRCAVLAVLVVVSAGAAFAQSAAPAAALAPAVALAIDAAARDAVAVGDVPGVVVVVGQDGSVLYRRATGSRALVPAVEPMTIDTVFDVASLTKVVATTPAILALVDDRKIDLDAPLGRYLREFQGPRLAWLTVRRVLTHTAGLPDIPSSEVMAKGLTDGLRVLAAGVSEPSPTAPFRYSDTGFIVLAELVRHVSGEPLDRFTRKRFYQPLGMRETTFNPPTAWHARIAPTEFAQGQMLRGIVHDPRARQLHGVAGHAGLFSTADDLGRFCRMLLADGMDGGRRYLSSASVRAMFALNEAGEATRGLVSRGMNAVVAKLTEDDFIALAAYVASRPVQ